MVEVLFCPPVGPLSMKSALSPRRVLTWMAFSAGLWVLMLALVDTMGDAQARLRAAAIG